jgi:VNT family MFS transporter (synaptic vesicle glycoprotein 2)
MLDQRDQRSKSRRMSLTFLEDHQADYEEAILQTKFGKFHLYLLCICGLTYLQTAISITIISFVLPSASCDFRMTSIDKGEAGRLSSTIPCSKSSLFFSLFLGWLTASPLFGMILGSYFFGCLADTKGRKYVLIASLLLDGVAGLLSSISQIYALFMLFRFFTGFG